MTTATLPRAPRVFVSHATEDRARFVDPFSRLLRHHRVDAWLSFWEMQPSDSLPRKNFEQGIGEADTVVVVVSAPSLTKPWVQAEIEVATEQRIAGNVRIIAVVLENAPVLVQVSSLLWVPVPVVDAAGVEGAARSVIDAAYGVSTRPPLGDAPAYVRSLHAEQYAASCGLSSIDVAMLHEAIRQTFAHEHANRGHPTLEFEQFAVDMARLDVQVHDVADSVFMLEERGYVKDGHALGPGHPLRFRMTTAGIESMIGLLIEGYHELRRRVAGAVVNAALKLSDQIAATVAVPQPIVDHELRAWEAAGRIALSKTIAPVRQIVQVTPHLRLRLAE